MTPESKAPDGTKLWLLMLKAYHAMEAYAAPTLRASGLADSDFRVLEALLHKGALPVNTIGAKVFLTPGSISVAVDRLLERGLVTRVEDAADRRVRIVDLTPKGRKLIECVFAAHAAEMNALADEIPAADRRQFAAMLKTLGKNADACNAKPRHVPMEVGNRTE
jgi:MarR family 2-MHQ and catechol resistance regulon transcriptional repressor